MEQWFSYADLHQNHQEDLFRESAWSQPQSFWFCGLDWGQELALLPNSQMTLMFLGWWLSFENRWCGWTLSVQTLKLSCLSLCIVAVQSLSCVIPWTAAHQASLSFTISWSLLKLMSIELVMQSSHLFLCHPLLLLPSFFLSIRVFPTSHLFALGGQSIGASASASVLLITIQGWFPLGLTDLIS